MDAKYKDQFELINNSLWLLIKPYAKDDKKYKNIMSELFKNYMECDKTKAKFTDEWWEQVGKIYDIPEKHRKDQGLCGFAADLAEGFYSYFKLQNKRDVSILDFYRTISQPFLNEWERLKHDNGNTS